MLPRERLTYCSIACHNLCSIRRVPRGRSSIVPTSRGSSLAGTRKFNNHRRTSTYNSRGSVYKDATAGISKVSLGLVNTLHMYRLTSPKGFGVWGLGFGVWGLGFGVWEIGRASCRERGEISVVAVSLKKED